MAVAPRCGGKESVFLARGAPRLPFLIFLREGRGIGERGGAFGAVATRYAVRSMSSWRGALRVPGVLIAREGCGVLGKREGLVGPW